MPDAPPPLPVELERARFAPRRTATQPPPAAALDGEPAPAAESPRPSRPGHPEPSGPPASPASTTPPPTRPRPVVQAELAKAIAGALLITAAAAGLLLRRPGRRLRRPLRQDLDAVAQPVSRIVTRHVPLDLAPGIALSIWDACEAAGAAMEYADRGPLLEPERNPEPPPPAEEEALS